MFLKPFRGARLNRTHPLARGLVAAYLFNEGGGNQVFDITQIGGTGTFQNDVSWTAGIDGPAINFPGSDDAILLPNEVGNFTDDFSIVVRYKTSAVNGTLVSRIDIVTQYLFFLDGSGRITLSDGVGFRAGVTNTSDGLWHTGVLAVDGANSAIYLDGNDDNISSTPTITGDAGGAFIGARRGTQVEFIGDMSYVYFFNRALSASEAAQLSSDRYAFIERPLSKGALFAEEIVAAGIVPILEHHYRMTRNNE